MVSIVLTSCPDFILRRRGVEAIKWKFCQCCLELFDGLCWRNLLCEYLCCMWIEEKCSNWLDERMKNERVSLFQGKISGTSKFCFRTSWFPAYLTCWLVPGFSRLLQTCSYGRHDFLWRGKKDTKKASNVKRNSSLIYLTSSTCLLNWGSFRQPLSDGLVQFPKQVTRRTLVFVV